MAILAIALFWGAWKSALLLLAAALVAAPIRWTRGPLRHLPAEHLERGALCLTLAILGMIATSLETSTEPFARETPYNPREPRPATPGRASRASSGGGSAGLALPQRIITPQDRVTSWDRAIAGARDCDRAHSEAAGAIERISQSPDAQEARAAVQAAIAVCEASWISFSRPDLRADPHRAPSGHDPAIEACDQGYMGRWLANEHLLGAIDKGLAASDIAKVARINGEHDPAVSACAALLEKAPV